VSFMCAWLGVSRSGYYAWRGAEPSQRSRDDSALVAVTKKIHGQARGNPGVRRMRAGLAALGHLVPHKRVHRLMQATDLRGRLPRAWKADHHRRGQAGPRPGPDRPGFHRCPPGCEVVRRRHLHKNMGRVGLSISYVESPQRVAVWG
jgi:putative transposase